HKFEDPIIRVLLVAAFLSLGISFLHNDFIETIGIFFAIFLATGIAFWFEVDAGKKFDILNKVNDETLVKVIREGNISEIQKQEIVYGDIVLLETGDEVPADAELLETVSLSVNESTLTGEPLVHKSADSRFFDKEATYPTDRIFRGTTIAEGHCVCRVFAVGDSTEYGKVARKASEKSPEVTPLNRQLNSLAKLVGFTGFIIAFLTFSVLFAKDLFFGEVDYKTGETALLLSVIAGVFVAITKIWMPTLIEGLQVFGVRVRLPRRVGEGSWLFWMAAGMAVIIALFLVGYLFGVNPLIKESWISLEVAARILSYFMVAVTLIVVAVPEGLPMSVTLSLAMSMRRMLKTNNLVRKMHATETMGAATVICTDKTGTLTMNQMRVAYTFFPKGQENHKAEETDNNPSVYDKDNNFELIAEAISVNSTAYLDFSSGDRIKTLGNPTEAALLIWLHEKGVNYLRKRRESELKDQLAFSTERKYMATRVRSALLQEDVLYVKGAPEIITSRCKDLPPQTEKLLQGYQSKAMRTLGLAYKIIKQGEIGSVAELAEDNLIFMGVVAISDPVREDVPAAVAKCLRAGIDVKIVTGDTPGTAREIGRQIGILGERVEDGEMISGVEFEGLTDAEAAIAAKKLKVMCRARPSDKQRLVQLLQGTGAVVAVTGDGTNDAPALNYAHVGLSMGSGTSVAKEASDITLLDDSFNSIATAVMWGRSLYKNIQRFIIFQLTINVTALIVVFLGSVFGHELPLTVTQMLWVNLIMDTFAAGALASLPPEEDVMRSSPRGSSDFIITPSMRWNILATAGLFVALLFGLLISMSEADGEVSGYNLSVFFTVFVMFQFWNLFNAKRYGSGKSSFSGIFKSPGFLLVAVLIIIGQLLIVQFGGDVFRTVPISLRDWIMIIISTSGILWLGELLTLAGKLLKKRER
ncbi:MAG: cation-translocating P-type ATPase, partial [Bacteroidales bacterium]|nr:cation-translocating P-type ATPase [Bacteroidales bacterium]